MYDYTFPKLLTCWTTCAFQSDLDETLSELKACDDQSKKAMGDAARLADELRQEQEHSHHVERMRKGQEQSIKVLI